MPLELYTDFDKQGIIDIMKENYGEKKDLPDSSYYNMALEMFPEMNLPEWDKIVGQPTTYTSNPDSIDLSPDTVNAVYNVAEQSTQGFMDSMKTKVLQEGPSKDNFWDSIQADMPGRPLLGKLGTGRYARDTGSLMQLLVEPDSWVSQFIPDNLKTGVEIGLNQSATGKQYATENGKELYNVDFEDYEPNFGTDLAAFAASMSDPQGLLNMIATFAFGGSAHKAAWRGLKTVPPILSKWWQKSTGRYVVKSIPKTKTSSGLRKTILEKFSSDELAYGTGGFGTFGASMAAAQSARDQRMNYGKYSTNNGTINRWDIINDAWKGYKHHATTGFLLSGIGQTLGLTNMWANAQWQMGAKNYKTFVSRVISSPISKIGIQGTILTSVPMVLDEDIRKQYYDPETGEFDFSKWTAANILHSTVVAGFWGLHKFNMPRGRKGDGLVTAVSDRGPSKGKTYTTSAPITKYNTTDPGTAIIPRNRSIPRILGDISTKVVKDIKHETNKSIDLEYTGNEESKLLTQSIANIKKDLGPETPFEFFEKDIDIKTEPVETLEGLKTIKEVVDNTLNILNRAGTKNTDGDYVGFDLKKITGEDIAYITTVMPTVVRAYQGYKLDSYETDTGKAEYIKRFQAEENGGRPLTDIEKKTLLKAQEIEINRYDILSKDLNTKLTQGLFKSEQTQRITESELDEPMVDIIATNEEGQPLTGDILTVPKEEADSYVKQGKVILSTEAEKQNMRIGEVPSVNHGQVAPTDLASTKEMIASAVEQGILRTQDISEGIPKNKAQYDRIVKGVKGNELQKIPELKNKEAAWSHIKHPYDIKILKDNFSGKDLAKRLPIINNILKHTGKKSITDLTTQDVKGYLDILSQPHNKLSPGKKHYGIDPNKTSNIKKIFQTLQTEGLVKRIPITQEMTAKYSADYRASMAKKKAEEPLPVLKEWYKGLGAIKELMKKDKAFVKGVEIIETYPIRAEELNVLKGRHIVLHQPTGEYYIDLMQDREHGGIAKDRGRKRPVNIPVELARELQKLSGGNPNKLIFPGFTNKLTQASKQIFGKDYITSKAFKEQEKIFAEQRANLSREELDIYMQIAGHGEESKISEYYKQRGNWADLFKLQKQVIQKVAMAKQEFMQEEGLSEKIMGAVQKGLTSGLSIEDVSGKEPKAVIAIATDDIKDGATLSDDVKKKLASSVRNIWDELTKDMTTPERIELRTFYATSAGITAPDKFKINKDALETDLALFADEIIDTKVMKSVDRKNTARRYINITHARRLFEINDYNEKAQSMLLHKMFFSERNIADVNLLELSHKQSEELLEYMNNSPHFKEYDAFDYVSNALNVENIGKLSRQFTSKDVAALYFGFHGTVDYAFDYLAKRLGAPELSKVGQDLIEHSNIELKQGNAIRDFEESSYKVLYEDTIEKGKAIFALRRGKGKYKHGISRFNKEIKNNLWSLDPKRYKWMAEHVKKHPEDKDAVARFKKAKPFYDKIYDKNGNLRIDTVESKIARAWYKFTQKDVWENIYLSLRSNMTDASYDSYIKKYPLKEIKKHFYVPRAVTQEFLDAYDVNGLNTDKHIEDGIRYHSQRLAEIHYGREKLTPKEIEKFKDKAMVEVGKDFIAKTNYGKGNHYNPKTILRRKMYLGERLYIAKENKWIDGYRHEYDTWAHDYSASAGKLIANLTKFPYLVQLPHLKFNQAVPKALLQIDRNGGTPGKYIHDMIASRTGLATQTGHGHIYGAVGKFMQEGNKYISRLNLANLTSPTKNFMLGFQQNVLVYELPDVLYSTYRAMSFVNRIQAQKTGMMGLSYSELMIEKDILHTSKVLDMVFNSSRFPTSEAITRLAAIYSSIIEMPRMVDGLRSSSPKEKDVWLFRAKDLYKLSDRQIELFTKYGLGTTEVDWNGEESIATKGIEAKRLGKADKKLNPIERQKLQRELDLVHSQIMNMAHVKTQGSTQEIFQPFAMQDPVVKGGALYSQLAIQAAYNTLRAIRENRRNGNWHRTFAYGASGVVTAGILGGLIHQIVLGMPNPDELSTKVKSKLFRTLSWMEFGGIHSWVWRVLNGEPLYGNPYSPFPLYEQSLLALEVLADAGRAGIEAAGIKPEAFGGFAKYFVRNARDWQTPKKFAKSVVGIYRNWKSINENHLHPYKSQQNDIDKWEESFFTEVKPVSSKPEIVSNTIMSGHYKKLKDAFEMSEDMNYIAETFQATWWARYGEFINSGHTPDGAAEAASAAMEAKLLSLNPILNGLGAGKDAVIGKWMSLRDEYMLYLTNTAIVNKEPPSKYTAPLLKQEALYKAKRDNFLKFYKWWIRQNYNLDEYKKYWSRIHPESWSKLGLRNLNP